MRLLFVVQRYGHEVAGGAEVHCRQFATRLAARGHGVEVLTSCALSYVDWADWYPVGSADLDGVLVHRLPVDEERQERFFGPLNGRVPRGRKPVPLHLQREWMLRQGPHMRQLPRWLAEHAEGYEAIIFFTYLYYPTWAGLPVASALVPTVLHPTVHDEPALQLPIFEPLFRQPWAFAFSTEEEAALVSRRFRMQAPGAVIGIGTDLDASGDPLAFRRRFGLGDRPYLVFIGRLEPGKGSEELFEFFCVYKTRNPGHLALVVVGEPVKPLPRHPDVFVTGFVDEETKRGALAGALALAQPSYFESFSMVLMEAWVMQKPALVQGHCAVLEGQVNRSGGGIPYRGFAEFEGALDVLLGDGEMAGALGCSGRRFVEEKYHWDAVLGRYERLLARVAG
ncbi:MAG: glycosyltransferase family 4 protein [Acidimicrobiia bacterium]